MIQNKDNWRNRRRVQYIALALSAMFIASAAMYPHLTEVAAPFFIFLGVLVGGYQAAATFEDTRKNN